MDSKHRHELAENALANWLADVIDRVRPYATLIAICLVGVVLISGAWAYYKATTQSSRARGWEMYTSAILGQTPDLAALEEASAEFNNEGAVANWASITYADGQLANAAIEYLDQREKARESLQKAQDEYNRLLLDRGVQQTIRQRAQYGLARSYELSGEIEKAIAEYEKVEGPFAELAQQRAGRLETKSAQQDYEWLKVAQAPARRSPQGPGTPGVQPEFSPDAIQTPAAPLGEETPSDDIFRELTGGAEDQEDVDIGALLEADTPPAETPAETPAEEAGPDPLMELLESDASDEAPAGESATEEAPAEETPPAETTDEVDESAPADDDAAEVTTDDDAEPADDDQ